MRGSDQPVTRAEVDELLKNIRTIVQAVQGNLDHLQGQVRNLATAYNLTVSDVLELEDKVNKIIRGV